MADHPTHATPPPPRVAPRPDTRAPWEGLPWMRWGLALASAATMFFLIVALNRGPEWEVRAISGQGVAVIDGRPVPLSHDDEIAGMIRPGARLRVPEGATITLASARCVALEIAAGTDAVVPGTPGRWYGRGVRSEVQSGMVRITTGERFRGARLTIRTPAAELRARGGTLAVTSAPEGTCVSLLEGEVVIGAPRGARVAVPPGSRHCVDLDGRDTFSEEMDEEEAVKLADFSDAQRGVLGAR